MEKIVQTAGRDILGAFAPDFAHYNDDVLFGENWNSAAIDRKTRCILTMTALISQGITDSSLKYHLENAKKNGVTQTEAAAIITHIAFYAGWPKAWAAFGLAKEIWSAAAPADDALAAYAASIFFPIGAPNDAYAAYFSGQSWLAPVAGAPLPIYNVTFAPACRNNWHIHHAKEGGGQMLICIGGRGYYQAEGEEPIPMTPGTIVTIPPNVRHWHGAARKSYFSHLAFEVPGTETSNEWCEAVSDEAYEKLS